MVVCYSCLFKIFPQFVVIHTVVSFIVVSETIIIIIFLNAVAFSMIQQMLAI